MKIVILITALICAGCSATAPANRDYANNCGYAMDQELLCSSYVSPHGF
ncbi:MULTISPECIES: hypothetical protein [unclassified Mesorhizobium]|nr:MULTISPECIES: hypothetical protein [unclassified Mesorhizobium]